METLKRDSAFNFFGVLHLQKYLEGHNGYIAGGCFKNIFKKESVKDIDIFFENEGDFNRAQDKFSKDENYEKIYENDNAIGYFHKRDKIAIDLVKSEFLPPDKMINSFDFTITKFAFHTNENEDSSVEDTLGFEGPLDNQIKQRELLVTYHEDFFTHLTLNRLVIDNDLITFPLNTFDRMLRYAKYGYAPCTGTKAKIVRAMNSVSLPKDDTDLFKGFYVGVD